MNHLGVGKSIIIFIFVMALSSVVWPVTAQSLSSLDGMNSSTDENSDAQWSAAQMSLLFKFVRQRDEAIAGIRKADETIAKAQNLISRAQAADNKAAETVAVRALQTAQETKHRYEQKKIQVEKNSAYVRNRMANKIGMDTRIAGMVTQHSGRVHVSSGKPPYETVPLNTDQAGYFEEGDTISTYNNSGALIECFDGRGTLKIGEYSSVKMEKKDVTTEALTLMKGKIHIAIEKAEALEQWADDKGSQLVDDPDKFLQKEFGALRANVKKYSKKFEVRTPSAVTSARGTAFTVTTDDTGATVVEMIQGVVDVSNLKTSAVSSLKEGEKITIAQDGTSVLEANRMEPSKEWWGK